MRGLIPRRACSRATFTTRPARSACKWKPVGRIASPSALHGKHTARDTASAVRGPPLRHPQSKTGIEMGRRDDDRRERERGEELRRQAQILQHLGWRSAYAPTKLCPHTVAVEIENDDPILHPDPLPQFWIPIRLRHWVCAECRTAVNPHAFRANALHSLSEIGRASCRGRV